MEEGFLGAKNRSFRHPGITIEELLRPSSDADRRQRSPDELVGLVPMSGLPPRPRTGLRTFNSPTPFGRRRRLAVLSDVHSNLPALQAVLADVDRIAPDGIWVAGDLVGYNPWPNEVLEILRERHVRAIRGNHDRGAIGGDTSWFNELAAEGVRWTRIHLAPAGVGYLKDLEDRTRGAMPEGLVAMYHGSPRNDDEYVFPWAADESIIRAAGAPFVIL